MDAVRGVHFTSQNQMVSASEDCTLKVWDLQHVLSSQQVDIEPVMTLRGHTGPIMTMTGASLDEGRQWWQGMLFSGGTDGSMAIWRVPQHTKHNPDEAYLDSEGPENGKLVAVWD